MRVKSYKKVFFCKYSIQYKLMLYNGMTRNFVKQSEYINFGKQKSNTNNLNNSNLY